MNYTPKQIEGFNAKDKRISFLSIFSSLTRMWKPTGDMAGADLDQFLFDEAIKLNSQLYENYPFPNPEDPEVIPDKNAY